VDQLADLGTYILAMRPADVLDVALVGVLVFLLLYAVRGTRAVPLIRGILLLVLVVFLVSQVARLQAFGYLARILLPAMLFALPVIFQPELRRALERLGRAGTMLSWSGATTGDDSIVTVVSLAARQLAADRHGALIVLERTVHLGDLIDRGVPLDAVASVELLRQVFYPNTPLHDGAVVIRGGRIVAAAVVLPLSDTVSDDRDLGTRHLAAQSITENTDALAVVVSEETSTISLARNGELIRHLDERELARLLYRWYVTPGAGGTGRWFQPLWHHPVAERLRGDAPASAPPAPAVLVGREDDR
jgi:diadenylate cyclase